tara:strand:+ start:63 stop:440 length:378 start_codon:yes stop_codon:yes gene_type:complete
MIGIIILIVVIVVTFYLGRYAIREGLRIEDNNKIMENIRLMEQRDIMDTRKEIITTHNTGLVSRKVIYERNPDTDEIRSRELMDYDNEKMVNPAVNAIPTITYTDSFDDGVCEGEYDHDAIRGED